MFLTDLLVRCVRLDKVEYFSYPSYLNECVGFFSVEPSGEKEWKASLQSAMARSRVFLPLISESALDAIKTSRDSV